MDKPLKRLLDEFTLEAIGKAAGVTKQAVGQWKRIPAERVPALSKNLKKTYPELRPDLYPSGIQIPVDNLS